MSVLRESHHPSAYVSIREHTLSIKTNYSEKPLLREAVLRESHHPSAYVSIREHTSAYVEHEDKLLTEASRQTTQRSRTQRERERERETERDRDYSEKPQDKLNYTEKPLLREAVLRESHHPSENSAKAHERQNKEEGALKPLRSNKQKNQKKKPKKNEEEGALSLSLFLTHTNLEFYISLSRTNRYLESLESLSLSLSLSHTQTHTDTWSLCA